MDGSTWKWIRKLWPIFWRWGLLIHSIVISFSFIRETIILFVDVNKFKWWIKERGDRSDTFKNWNIVTDLCYFFKCSLGIIWFCKGARYLGGVHRFLIKGVLYRWMRWCFRGSQLCRDTLVIFPNIGNFILLRILLFSPFLFFYLARRFFRRPILWKRNGKRYDCVNRYKPIFPILESSKSETIYNVY